MLGYLKVLKVNLKVRPQYLLHQSPTIEKIMHITPLPTGEGSGVGLLEVWGVLGVGLFVFISVLYR